MHLRRRGALHPVRMGLGLAVRTWRRRARLRDVAVIGRVCIIATLLG